MKKIFKIDAALYPLMVLTIATGFGFHIAGHADSHHIWVVWAYVHTFVALAFVGMIIQHLSTHKAWLKGLRQKSMDRRRKITLFLIILAVAVTVSGIALLGIDGANTSVGLTHYKLGIAFAIFAIGHSAKRFKTIRKAFGNINPTGKRQAQ